MRTHTQLMQLYRDLDIVDKIKKQREMSSTCEESDKQYGQKVFKRQPHGHGELNYGIHMQKVACCPTKLPNENDCRYLTATG